MIVSFDKLSTHPSVRNTEQLPYAKQTSISPFLRVRFAQTTFDAEGNENSSMWFSRRIHWSGGGVTIGRGYDMGHRSALVVTKDLLRAGVPHHQAVLLAHGAGLQGEDAHSFVQRYQSAMPMITLSAQKKLFEEVTAPVYVADIKRIFNKPDVVSKYGQARWESLSERVKEFVFDLRYRGDFTPTVRRELQPLLVDGNAWDVARLASNSQYWAALGVPAGRIRKRAEIFR